jgi:hypothetical protein
MLPASRQVDVHATLAQAQKYDLDESMIGGAQGRDQTRGAATNGTATVVCRVCGLHAITGRLVTLVRVGALPACQGIPH